MIETKTEPNQNQWRLPDLKIPLLPAAQFRSLTEEEQETMFLLYDKHSGNLSAVTRDPESVFHSRNQLVYYKKVYGWQDKLIQIRTERAQQVIENLGAAKLRAIQRAMELLESRIEEVPSLMTGQVLRVRKDPMYKEIQTAWEIIKTELGEPTVIAKEKVEGQVDHNIREVKIVIVKNEKSNPTNPSDSSVRKELPGDQQGSGGRGRDGIEQIILPGPTDGDQSAGG